MSNWQILLKKMNDKHSEFSLFRILDAAFNRTNEGLRVVEDYVRLACDDEFLSVELKRLRHDLAAAGKGIDRSQRMRARDTLGDVGTEIELPSEYQRTGGNEPDGRANFDFIDERDGGIVGTIKANFSRAQQGLRTIEEFSKLLDIDVSKKVEQIRYRCYSLEKSLYATLFGRRELVDARLYALINAQGEWESQVKAMVEAGVDLIQLRDKDCTDREIVSVGKRISELTRGSDTAFIMNDRADLAKAAGADGVHLGQDDLTVGEARRVVGLSKLIGVSTHSLVQAREAVLEGADYIGVGPVFPSTTKHFEKHVGLELVREVAAEIRLPMFAIGGVTLENLPRIIESGARRVAVSGAMSAAGDTKRVVREFKRCLSG